MGLQQTLLSIFKNFTNCICPFLQMKWMKAVPRSSFPSCLIHVHQMVLYGRPLWISVNTKIHQMVLYGRPLLISVNTTVQSTQSSTSWCHMYGTYDIKLLISAETGCIRLVSFFWYRFINGWDSIMAFKILVPPLFLSSLSFCRIALQSVVCCLNNCYYVIGIGINLLPFLLHLKFSPPFGWHMFCKQNPIWPSRFPPKETDFIEEQCITSGIFCMDWICHDCIAYSVTFTHLEKQLEYALITTARPFIISFVKTGTDTAVESSLQLLVMMICSS